jgi:hypothetical protein
MGFYERNLSTYSGGRALALVRKERFAWAQVSRFQSIGGAENECEKHPEICRDFARGMKKITHSCLDLW